MSSVTPGPVPEPRPAGDDTGVPDLVPVVDHGGSRTPVSPKVVFSALGVLAAQVLVVLLDTLVSPAGQPFLAGLPPVVVVLLVAVVPTLVAFLAGYAKRDPLRDTGAAAAPGGPLLP